MPESSLHPRVEFDLQSRASVFGADEVIRVAAGGEAFWDWYARAIRPDRPFRLESVPGVPAYPVSNSKVALWYSGGVESTYTLDEVRHLEPVPLHIEDYDVFRSDHRRIGQIHFICAALGSAAGYSRIFLGVERDDLLLSHTPQGRSYLERTPAFIEAWSRYQPQHALETVCGHLYKEQIMLRLKERGLRITGTCDRIRGGEWCGDCYKCFEAFYTSKAVGLDLGIRLSRVAIHRYLAEFTRYVQSEFRDNYNNAYQHYVRLQILYRLRFEPEVDGYERAIDAS